MAYNHPCGVLENQPTLKDSITETPISCVYNDLCAINGEPYNYECTHKNGCPSDCEELYHTLKSRIKSIEKGAEILEKIVNKMKKDKENEDEINLYDEVQSESVQDMPEDS